MKHPALRRRAAASAVAAALLLATAGTSLAATAVTDVYRISMDGLVVPGCGEDLLLSGEILVNDHLTDRDEAGVAGHFISAATGLTALGLTSGATYRAVGVTVQVGSQDSPFGTYNSRLSITLVDRTFTIGTAGAPTLKIGTTFHITKLDAENAVIFEHGPYVTCT